MSYSATLNCTNNDGIWSNIIDGTSYELTVESPLNGNANNASFSINNPSGGTSNASVSTSIKAIDSISQKSWLWINVTIESNTNQQTSEYSYIFSSLGLTPNPIFAVQDNINPNNQYLLTTNYSYPGLYGSWNVNYNANYNDKNQGFTFKYNVKTPNNGVDLNYTFTLTDINSSLNIDSSLNTIGPIIIACSDILNEIYNTTKVGDYSTNSKFLGGLLLTSNINWSPS